MSGVMVMNFGVPCKAAWMGENRPLPPCDAKGGMLELAGNFLVFVERTCFHFAYIFDRFGNGGAFCWRKLDSVV